MTVSRSLTILGALAMVAATPLAAQEFVVTRLAIAPVAAPISAPSTAAMQVSDAAAGPRHRWPYVVGGAAVGAIAGGLLLANRIGHEQDPRLVPRHAIVYIGLGAGLGALGGWALSGAAWWPRGVARAPLPDDR